MRVDAYCFRRQEVQTALVGRALYKCYGPGRWILKEGHPAEHMYLIVKGRARVTERVYNVVFKTTNTVERGQLAERQSFGESALMFNTRRITSVQSLSTYNRFKKQAYMCTEFQTSSFRRIRRCTSVGF